MKKIFIIIGSIFPFLGTYAVSLIPCPDGSMADPTIGCVMPPASIVNAESGLLEILLNFADGLTSLITVVATIALIHGGLNYMIHSDNESETQKSKRIIFWSLFGLVVGLIATFVVSAILDIIQ